MKWLTLAVALLVPAQAMASDLAVTIVAASDGGQSPVISGTTNLPAGMILAVSITNIDSGFTESQDVTVAGAKFKTEPFTAAGAALQPGTYFVDISSEDYGMQPPAVMAVIGTVGQNMSGPAVTDMTTWQGIDDKVTITVP